MIATDVSRYLAAEGHGTEGTDLFISQQPDEPDACVTVLDESAPQPDEASVLAIDHWGFQVLTRAADYPSAVAKAKAVHQQLAGFNSGQLAGAGPVVSFIAVVTQPTSIGRDGQKRPEVSAHYFARAASTGDTHRA